jgi:hypothetical protein
MEVLSLCGTRAEHERYRDCDAKPRLRDRLIGPLPLIKSGLQPSASRAPAGRRTPIGIRTKGRMSNAMPSRFSP